MAINRGQIVQIKSVGAPVGGLNARDSYADMPPTDAVVLDNLFPYNSYVAVRNGSQLQMNGINGQVNTLACYSPPLGSRKLFAAAGGAIYDVTLPGPVGAPVFSGTTSDWWQHVNFGAGGGQYLVMVNGQDPMLLYNGSGWEAVGNGTGAVISSATAVGTLATITTATPHLLSTGVTVTIVGATPAAYNIAGAVITVTGANTFTLTLGSAPGGAMTVIGTYSYTPSITGVSPNTFISVNNFQGRLYFIQKNTMRVWFLPALAVGGAATMLDLSSQTLLGGYLVAMATWTLETTAGLVQMACFITSEGEVLTYQGNDPTYASSWYQVGSFRVGRPIGYRCYAKFGSDVVVITTDGLIPLSKALLTDRSQRSVAITDKIMNLINQDVASYSAYLGWKPILYPLGNKVILNVPAPQGSYQYVMNTLNGSWCRFTGWLANCWEVVGDQIFYGTAGAVYQADTGESDTGSNINCVCVQAMTNFGSDVQKQFTMARPVITSNGPLLPAFQINTDFNFTNPNNVENYVTAAFTYWSPPWYSPWSPVNQVYRNWLSVGSIGYVGAPAIAFASNGVTVSWQATDVAFTLGGPW
jgi:hypothetical protein